MRSNLHKLSASALSTFLESPKQFYWKYVKNLEPILPSVGDFSHDRLCGVAWGACVSRFYNGMGEKENTDKLLKEWMEGTEGWVTPKTQERYTEALKAWAAQYYQQFSPSDGCRSPDTSEMKVENERFIGYLDGFDKNNEYIHECKSTSQSPQLSEQLLKVQSSIQVKLYAVLTQAKGAVIEFAFKQAPYVIFRAPPIEFTEKQLKCWEQELNALADKIYALGDKECNYVCHADGCCIVTKNFVSVCAYQSLCLGIEGAEAAFKQREHRNK